MKKGKADTQDGMRRSYNRSDFPAGFVRGKYAMRMAQSDRLVRLRPEIAAAFPTSEAVNAALATLLRRKKSEPSAARTGARPRAK